MSTSEPTPEGTRSEVSGPAGNVFQARDVSGGVHFHRSAAEFGDAPRQLPGDIRGFVNRTAELGVLGEITRHPGDDRGVVIAVVIVGTAGVGKTSLALRWAHRARDDFPDGELYVNLRGYDPGRPVTPDVALDRFLRALGVRPNDIPSDLEARSALYRSRLVGRRMLVLLDNAATVGQVRPLLPGTPDCLVVVTSRSRLSGLVSRNGARRLTLELLHEDEAVKLIESVARDYRKGDEPEEIAELARLCARLPLALRIAAERAASRPHMPLSQLIRDLRDESALWSALSSEDDDEAGAVRTVFAWSYRALPEPVARLFRLLGLHPGAEFGVPAAAVLAEVPIAVARQRLDVLVGAHLLEETAPGRYQFHDLLRAYATDQVNHVESVEERRSHLRRLLVWYLHTADAANAAMKTPSRRFPLDPPEPPEGVPAFADHSESVAWYEFEFDNLFAATNAAARAEMSELAWQLPLVARVYGSANSSLAERARAMELALVAARRAGSGQGEALALSTLGGIHARLRDFPAALAGHEAALVLRQALGDREGEAVTLTSLGIVHLFQRRFAVAAGIFRQVHGIYREIGNTRRSAHALYNLAEAHVGLGEPTAAADDVRAALAIQREYGDRYGEAVSLGILAKAQIESGEVDDALDSATASAGIARELKYPTLEGYGLLDLGHIQRISGKGPEGLESYQRAAAIHRVLGDRSREAMALDGAGEIYLDLGRPDEAADFHRRAVAVHGEIGDDWESALALFHLGNAVSRLGSEEEADEHWRQALSRLSGFTDPMAERVRRQVEQALGG